MYTISLAALLIVAAEASASAGYRGSSRYSPSYGSYGRSHSYGGYSAPKSYGYSAPKSYGYSAPSHYHAPADDSFDSSTWYTQYQQYRPAKIAFKPVETKAPVYAVCELANVKIQLAQLSGHKSMVKLSQTNSGTAAVDEVLTFTIHEDETCDAVFNPLLETDHLGRKLMYQDESRGSISDFKVVTVNTYDTVLKDQCFNLTGHNGVIGRSIALKTDQTGNTTLNDATDCCAIRYEKAPDASGSPTHHHHNSHSNHHGGHGYGGYGGYHH